jgi:hypothetical protein
MNWNTNSLLLLCKIKEFELDMAPTGTIDSFLQTPAIVLGSGDPSKPCSGAQLLGSLEVELEGYESKLWELNSYSKKLTVEYNKKVDLQEVLEKADRFFMTDGTHIAVSKLSAGNNNGTSNKDNWLESEDLGTYPNLDMHFSSITGVVSTKEKARFGPHAEAATSDLPPPTS